MKIAIIGAGNVGKALAGSAMQMKHGWAWQAGWKLVGPDGDAA